MSIRVAGGVVARVDTPTGGGGTDVPPSTITTLNTEDFQADTGAWNTPGVNEPEDAWTRIDGGGTPSSSSGPTGGSNPDTRDTQADNGYIYTEASIQEDGPWSLESPVLDASVGTLTLTFDLHMYFAEINDGTLKVQGWNGTAWSDIGSPIIGSKQDSNGQAWRPSTDFGTFNNAGFSNTDFRFRFLADRGSGRFVSYDFAIDNIEITGEAGAIPVILGFDTGLRRLHVSQDDADPIDGTTPDLKFTTIQAALDAVEPGDVVTIADGRYFEALSLTNFPGTPARPLWIVAENRGGVIVSNLQPDALDGSAVWVNEGNNIYSTTAAEAPYVAWEGDVMLPRWSFADLQATTFQATASDSKPTATFNKITRGCAFDNGRVYVRLGDDTSPSGQNISITNLFDATLFNGASAKNIILDGIEFEGGGKGTVVKFDTASDNPTVRNCIFTGCEQGVLVQADNTVIILSEFVGAPGYTQFCQDLRTANALNSDVVERYNLDYYYAQRFIDPGLSRLDGIMDGGIDTTAFGGRAARNVRITLCLITECFNGSNFGRHASGLFDSNVLTNCQNIGLNLRSFVAGQSDTLFVFENLFQDCFTAISHGNPTSHQRHLVYRCLLFNFDATIARSPAFIGTRDVSADVDIRYYQNTFISRLAADIDYVDTGTNHWIWFGASTSGANLIRTFQNNIVIMPNDLDSADVNPVSSGILSNAVVSPSDDAVSQLVQGTGGVYAGATEDDMVLDDFFAPDDGTITGSLTASPALGIGTALEAGLVDSFQGAGVNDNAGALNQTLNSDDNSDFPRPAFRFFDDNQPDRWTRPAFDNTPPPPITPVPGPPPVTPGDAGAAYLASIANYTVKGSGRPFVIFHEVRFNGAGFSPESLGWIELETVYQSIWTPTTPRPFRPGNPVIIPPSQSLVNSIVGNQPDIFVPDIESWWPPSNDGTTPYTSQRVDAFVLTADRINNAKGNKVWGFYSTVPRRSYFGAVDPAKRSRYFAANTINIPIAERQDILFPSLYTFSTLRNQDDWDTYATTNISEARRISNNKAVVAYLWPWFHARGTEAIPTGFMRRQLNTLVDAGVEGVVIWQTSQNNRLPFSAFKPWFDGVQQFIADRLDAI